MFISSPSMAVLYIKLTPLPSSPAVPLPVRHIGFRYSPY